jgi:hypothetical protein
MTYVKRVLAALAGACQLAPHSSAVNLSSNRVGEALVYPYFIARDGQFSLLTLVNRANQGKAVKLHVREGLNGASVLSLNVFLAPNDVWTAAIGEAGDGAALYTVDDSCTMPPIPKSGLAFHNRQYLGDAETLRSLDRTREGYVEALEMATIKPTSITGGLLQSRNIGVIPRPSTAAPCDAVSDATVATRNSDYTLPEGGLSGSITLVGDSMSTSIDAIALNGLSIRTGPTTAQSLAPDWSDVTDTTTTLLNDGNATDTQLIVARFDRGIDAVSAALMASALEGEYAYEAQRETVPKTDWLVTFPTKRHYVNSALDFGPFQRAWSSNTGTATVDVDPTSFMRDGASSLADSCFATRPPSIQPTLKWSASTIRFLGQSGSDASAALRSRNVQPWLEDIRCGNGGPIQNVDAGGRGVLHLVPNFESDNSQNNSHRLVSRADSTRFSVKTGVVTSGGITFVGLPAIGVVISAATFPGAVQNNYNTSNELRTIRKMK